MKGKDVEEPKYMPYYRLFQSLTPIICGFILAYCVSISDTQNIQGNRITKIETKQDEMDRVQKELRADLKDNGDMDISRYERLVSYVKPLR